MPCRYTCKLSHFLSLLLALESLLRSTIYVEVMYPQFSPVYCPSHRFWRGANYEHPFSAHLARISDARKIAPSGGLGSPGLVDH